MLPYQGHTRQRWKRIPNLSTAPCEAPTRENWALWRPHGPGQTETREQTDRSLVLPHRFPPHKNNFFPVYLAECGRAGVDGHSGTLKYDRLYGRVNVLKARLRRERLEMRAKRSPITKLNSIDAILPAFSWAHRSGSPRPIGANGSMHRLHRPTAVLAAQAELAKVSSERWRRIASFLSCDPMPFVT